MLFKLESEKQFLSAAIRFPAILAECPLNERDFSPVNRVVFSALKACVASNAEFSHHILVDRLSSYGIKIADSIDPGVYIGALVGLGVVEKAGIGIAKELKRTTVRRELHEIGRKIQAATAQDIATGDKEPKKAAELLAEVTGIFNEHVNVVSGSKEHEPLDLYATMDKFINEETSFDTGSVPSPFKLYNDLYGWFDPASIYLFVARLKVGKSALAMSMFQQMAQADTNNSLRALILDTEMSTEEVQSRILSSLSGVKEFYIRHKIYRKHKHMRDKVDEAYERMKPIWGRIEHVFIGGWSLEAQTSAARRWAHKRLRNGEQGIMALDYFKMSNSAEFNSKQSRDILLGAKVDCYKNLVKELRIPLVAFCQANRDGEDSKAGSRIQNSSVVAGSDMIAAFCSNIYLIEKLSPEQRAALGQLASGSATHSLKLIAPRQLGPNELGHDKLVKYKDGKADRWCENHILLSFENFVFKEVGMFADIYERNKSTATQVQPAVDKIEVL